MPPQLALLICIVFIIYLLRNDILRKPNVSSALWVPLIWFAIYASRPLSLWWRSGGGAVDASEAYLDGSPFDRNVFIIQIIVGIIILSRRVEWSEAFKANKAIFIYFAYIGLSTLWSDYTFISFKRWIKEIGHITMILIVLTEPDPIEGIRTMIKRSAFILLPMSLLFNRYYPQFGRMYSQGGGPPQYIGVTKHKNSLGALCLICGLVLLWNLFECWKGSDERSKFKEMFDYLIVMMIAIYLLYSANSATAMLGSSMAISIFTALNAKYVRGHLEHLKYYVIILAILIIIIHFAFNLMSLTTSGVGRDETLTGRTELWADLLSLGTNPLIGKGYESFWLGSNIEYLWEKYWWHPNQAHNGYLEIYLNLGWIGLIIVFFMIFSVFRKVWKNLKESQNYSYQVVRMSFLAVFPVINLTEAQFRGVIWLTFLLFGMFPPDSTKNFQFIRSNFRFSADKQIPADKPKVLQ
jgi:exopolysaccharide production protein ExoQ